MKRILSAALYAVAVVAVIISIFTTAIGTLVMPATLAYETKCYDWLLVYAAYAVICIFTYKILK